MHPDATTSDTGGRPSRRLIVVLTALAIATLWFSLGDNPLNGRSEGRYAVVSMNMAQGTGWLVPVFMDGPHLTKPPLTYWLEAICLRAFGYSEWSLRTPSAVAGSLTLLLVLWIGTRLYDARRGLLAMGVLAMMPLHLVMSRLTLTDALLALFWNATLVFGLLAVEEPSRRRWPALMWLAVTLGLLTKGPLAWAPVGLLLLWLALARQWSAIAALRLAIGLPAALLPLGGWVALVMRFHPEAVGIWLHEMFARVQGTSDLHPEPIWYFVPIFLVGLFPATLMMSIPGLNFPWPQARQAMQQRQREVLWTLAVVLPFVMFSLIKGKLPSYLLPLCAPLALLAAGVLERWLTGEADQRQHGVRPPWVIEPFVVSMAGVLVVAVIGAWMHLGQSHAWVAAPLVVQLSVSAWGWSVWRRQPQARATVLTAVYVLACATAMWAAEVEDLVTNPPSNTNLLARLEETTGLSPPFNLVLIDFKDATLTYYNRRPAPTVPVADLPKLARRHPDDLIVLVKDTDWQKIAERRPQITALFREVTVWSVWPSDDRRLVLRPIMPAAQPNAAMTQPESATPRP